MVEKCRRSRGGAGQLSRRVMHTVCRWANSCQGESLRHAADGAVVLGGDLD